MDLDLGNVSEGYYMIRYDFEGEGNVERVVVTHVD